MNLAIISVAFDTFSGDCSASFCCETSGLPFATFFEDTSDITLPSLISDSNALLNFLITN